MGILNHVCKIQIQGDDVKVDIVEKWQKGIIITKQEGTHMLNVAWNRCTASQKGQRTNAYRAARDYIANAPINGINSSSSWSQSFQDERRKVKNARIDIEIYRGAAFSNDRHIVYLRMKGADLSASLSWPSDSRHMISKSTGLKQLEDLWSRLDAAQQAKRNLSYQKALAFIRSAPDNGYAGHRSEVFQDAPSSNASIEIVIDKGAAFCV